MRTSDIVTISPSSGRPAGSAPSANARPPARRPRPYALALLVGALSIVSADTLRSDANEDRSSAGGGSPAPAAAPRPVDADTVRRLMRWIGENTSYRTEDVAPPRVVALRLGGRFLRAHHAEDPLPNRAFWARLERRC